MTLILATDVERLASTFLRAQAEVAAIVDTRVYTIMPSIDSRQFPLVILTLVGSEQVVQNPPWVETSRLQVSAYGGAKVLAKLLAETVRSVLGYRLTGAYAEGVVSDVNMEGIFYQPDEQVAADKPQPRYIFDVLVTTRPTSP